MASDLCDDSAGATTQEEINAQLAHGASAGVPPASTHCSLEEKLHKQHLDSQTQTMDTGRRPSAFRHGYSLRASSDDAQAMGLRGQRKARGDVFSLLRG